jgi:Na+/H+-translocating membrane pyrophosphatase
MGLEAEVGLLAGGLVSGFVLAVMMANSGEHGTMPKNS